MFFIHSEHALKIVELTSKFNDSFREYNRGICQNSPVLIFIFFIELKKLIYTVEYKLSLSDYLYSFILTGKQSKKIYTNMTHH
jgi:hypothetical protein